MAQVVNLSQPSATQVLPPVLTDPTVCDTYPGSESDRHDGVGGDEEQRTTLTDSRE